MTHRCEQGSFLRSAAQILSIVKRCEARETYPVSDSFDELLFNSAVTKGSLAPIFGSIENRRLDRVVTHINSRFIKRRAGIQTIARKPKRRKKRHLRN